ncbi:MAG: cupredoxin family copper-binding protein [Candidatus Udaeobacter sp.]
MQDRSTTLDPHPEFASWKADFGPAGLVRTSQPTLQRGLQGVDYGEKQNVQKLHAAVQREKRDGRVTIKPFPLWILVICGFVFFFAGFFSARHGADFTATNVDRGTQPPAQSTLQAVETGPASASAVQSTVAEANASVVAHVAMKNMKFSPATIEIRKGDAVEWKNDDITPHTATSAVFDSGSIASDAAWRHTFTEAGNFPYTCTFHPVMKGTIIVK